MPRQTPDTTYTILTTALHQWHDSHNHLTHALAAMVLHNIYLYETHSQKPGADGWNAGYD